MIIAFVGKGGVGKTSVSSAFALELSKSGKTMIVSTDFMPSLKSIFNAKDNVSVMELSESEVAKKWEEKYGAEVLDIAREFIDADYELVHHISTAPGVPEEFIISNLIELERSKEYDFIVWDTPASSSTMHLLALERDFYSHLNRDIKFYLKLKKKFRVSRALSIINSWRDLAEATWKGLTEASFVLVTTMDELALRQCNDITDDFNEMGLKIVFRICNRVREINLGLKTCSIQMEEYTGSARQIIEAMRPAVRTALQSLVSGDD
ncbi:MAG: AAA family ATPase [Candidatus Thermoplasmatota archaeon]|nr:AAA family ATPase [Candidatus Thermoplasmatota archaeon]